MPSGYWKDLKEFSCRDLGKGAAFQNDAFEDYIFKFLYFKHLPWTLYHIFHSMHSIYIINFTLPFEKNTDLMLLNPNILMCFLRTKIFLDNHNIATKSRRVNTKLKQYFYQHILSIQFCQLDQQYFSSPFEFIHSFPHWTRHILL